jgi:6-phosphogluconate dehydrogenase
MELGFVGLGKMGMNMVQRLLNGGHKVVAYALSRSSIKKAVKKGAKGAYSLQELASRLKPPRVIWIMVPAGKPTQDVIDGLLPFLDKDDILIDGGNSYYRDSIGRAGALRERGIYFLDAGTSGGIWGLKMGYCLMIGGERRIFKRCEPIFETLAPEDGYAHVGPNGAGHFVKMVHNGIEYALLQGYAEGFEIMHAKREFNLNLKKIASLWNHGSVIRSWLLELAEDAFRKNHDLHSIKGYVEDSGEGKWTVLEAMEEDVPAPVITLSLLQRFRSRQEDSFSAKVIVALRNEFGGHGVKRVKPR